MRRFALMSVALAVGLLGCDTGGDQEIGEQEYADELEYEAPPAAGEETRALAVGIRASFGEVDVDADGSVTSEEFQSWWDQNDPLRAWDADGDGMLNQEELQVGLPMARFEALDADGDGALSEDEVRDGLFDLYDQNGDGVIQQHEWPGGGTTEGVTETPPPGG